MRCDILAENALKATLAVSIPAGFSDALRLNFSLDVAVGVMFQSLLGFLMRCDDILEIDINAAISFNPCWVF